MRARSRRGFQRRQAGGQRRACPRAFPCTPAADRRWSRPSRAGEPGAGRRTRRQGAVVHLPVGTLRAGEVAGVSGVAVRGRAACRGVEKQRPLAVIMTFVHRTRLLRRRFASGLSLLGARGQAVGMRDEMGVCAALSNTGYWPKYRLRDRLLGRIRNEAARSIVLSSKTQRTTTKGVEIVRYGGYATFAPVTLPAPMAWLTMAPVPVPAALSAVLRPVLSCPAVLLSCCPTICPIPSPGGGC